ncbi:hypothetical protein Ahy_A06g029592 [Arachis hypogaea]|uniref:Uncharacterized protein n=1 Tax=Arachis hypogaea TaxID=3818 RepID=A0A445CTW1_ARAHY|nr:hypothetical protein Ahy_A06g029592 [Arachis hypogaea]
MMQDNRRERNHLTIWLRLDPKKELDVHFSTDERFKRSCLTNRANRASLRSLKCTGGSEISMKTKSRLSKSLDREVTLAEIFKYTNKERFAIERSATHYWDDSDSDSEALVVDLDRVWHETTSELYKNHIFGLGSFFASGLHTSALAASSASTSTTSPADLEEVVDLREEMQKLTQELY